MPKASDPVLLCYFAVNHEFIMPPEGDNPVGNRLFKKENRDDEKAVQTEDCCISSVVTVTLGQVMNPKGAGTKI